MLKILSILLIIGAVLSLIMCLVVAVGGNAASDNFNFTQLGTSVTLSALLGVFHLGAGIFGLKSIKDPSKEVLKNCMLCGILLLVGDIVAVINYKKSVID